MWPVGYCVWKMVRVWRLGIWEVWPKKNRLDPRARMLCPEIGYVNKRVACVLNRVKESAVRASVTVVTRANTRTYDRPLCSRTTARGVGVTDDLESRWRIRRYNCRAPRRSFIPVQRIHIHIHVYMYTIYVFGVRAYTPRPSALTHFGAVVPSWRRRRRQSTCPAWSVFALKSPPPDVRREKWRNRGCRNTTLVPRLASCTASLLVLGFKILSCTQNSRVGTKK